jgi:hypothetical protein
VGRCGGKTLEIMEFKQWISTMESENNPKDKEEILHIL